MRPQIVALLLRSVLIAGVAIIFLFIWFSTGLERAPLGLLIGISIAGLAVLWWAELQIQRALEVATGDK
jgi:hypothetical protein